MSQGKGRQIGVINAFKATAFKSHSAAVGVANCLAARPKTLEGASLICERLFQTLDSAALASIIRNAQYSACYAAPGIQREPAEAMAEMARRIGPELINVCLVR